MMYRRDDAAWASPVSLPDAKRQCRVVDDEEDALIYGLIEAAHERAELETCYAYGAGEWVIEVDPCGEIELPIWPVNSVVSVEHDGEPFAAYTLRRSGRTAFLDADEWPGAVEIRVNAGGEMPHTVRMAILLMVAHWFDSRATASEKQMVEIPYGARALLEMHRRVFA